MPTINDCEKSESSNGSPTIITCTTPTVKMFPQSVDTLGPLKGSPKSPHNGRQSSPVGAGVAASVPTPGAQQNVSSIAIIHTSPTPPMSLPMYHKIPPTCFGVSSPPGPRCYDIIEEELMFPLDEAPEHTNGNRVRNHRVHSRSISDEVNNRSSREFPSSSSLSSSVPKISVTEDQSDNSTTSSSFKSSSVTSSSCAGESFPDTGGYSYGSVTSQRGGQSPSMACHYHTVHGHGQMYQAPSIIPPVGVDCQSPNALFSGQNYRRNRSHSGPSYSPFSAQARHSAMISAGLSPGQPTNIINGYSNSNNNNCSRRRQSDDSDCRTSQAQKQRQSPGTAVGAFFDNFRPRSTSESKKKPSVITAIKNNLLNRGGKQPSSTTNGQPQQSPQASLNNNNNSNNINDDLQSESSSSITSENNTTNSVPMSQSMPNRVASPGAPLSPGSVIDPFSLELGYARLQQSNISHQEALFQQQLPHTESGSSNNSSVCASGGSGRKSRFRNRTGSIGAAANAVFEMFRNRSNSIAVTDANEYRQHRMTIGGHELCDHYDEILDENLVYARFFRFYRCYDIVPISAKLVVFDTKLVVKKAFFALLSNGVRAAPLWDSTKHEFVGMLTITDFIRVLHQYHQSPNLQIEEIEKHTIDNWRGMLKDRVRPLVHIQPDESLFSAIKMLITNHVHRLPVIDQDTKNVLYIITHKRILKYLFLYYRGRLPMPSFMARSLRELPRIGTYDNIVVAKQDTLLIDALTIMVEKRISALPIVDKKNKVVDIYAKFDAIHLAADKAYQNLDIPLKKALEHRSSSEEVVTCTLDESLHVVLERTVNAEVHRSIVIDQDKGVIGIISLSDLLNFLVLRPAENEKPKLDTSLSLALPSVRAANGEPVKSNSSSPSMIRSGATTPTTLQCSKVVEETPEEVLSAHSEESEPSSAAGSQIDLLNAPKDHKSRPSASSSSSNVSSSSSSGNINDNTASYTPPTSHHLNSLLTANGAAQNSLMVPSQ